ncbi:MAG: thioredoxin domain-containing protein [Candidatus Omnitrophota bacterium]|nr:thioredoxin domain-containing protein [Candidatus Omnitrophota bacterium]
MNKRYLIGGALVVLTIVGVVLFLKKQPAMEAIAGANYSAAKSIGRQGALIHMLEFSDFQCPACRAAQPTVKEAVRLYGNDMRVDFRHYPLSGHKWSALAHQSAECAAKQYRFWGYHDRLFDDQALWSKSDDPTAIFLGYAKAMGLDLEGFAQCLADETVRDSILEEKAQGNDLKVSSTPTFFVNGERFVGHIELKEKGMPFIRKKLGLPDLKPEESVAAN